MNQPLSVLTCTTLLAALSLLAGCQDKQDTPATAPSTPQARAVKDYLYNPGDMYARLKTCALENNGTVNEDCENAGRAHTMIAVGSYTQCIHPDQTADHACVDAVFERINGKRGG